MIYKDFHDLKLSALGFGAMRLPIRDGNHAMIDESATAEMVSYALEHGINYFDTAWSYHEGNSEIALGKALSKHPRESFYLATKFPGYDLSHMSMAETIFEKQLEKCRVTYFDFYLFHNVFALNIDAYLDRTYGLLDYLIKQKEIGRIRHLGFSVHGDYDILKRFLEAYGEDMEFCQIQLNYVDWSFQDAKAKVDLLNEHHIPIFVMEPVRGGKLASLPEDDVSKLRSLRPHESVPAWAFRFLQTIPSLTMILSGMSNLTQLQENIKTFETEEPLNTQELETLFGIADSMIAKIVLPCTSCRYCTEHCPQELDIPTLIDLYNEHCFTSEGGNLSIIAPRTVMSIPEDKRPSACIACKSCEEVCPQNILISEALADFAEKLDMSPVFSSSK